MNLNWEEVTGFGNLLEGVEKTHKALVDNLSGEEKSLLTEVSERFPRIEQQTFRKYIPSGENKHTDLADTERFLLLNPIHKGVKLQPVITFSADLTCKTIPVPKISIQVALGFRVSSGLRYLGYRFETPEGLPAKKLSDDQARHSFFHAQPIRTFGRNGIALNGPESDLAAIPEDQPSFVLSANDFVSFGLSVFVSLYGGHFLKDAQIHEWVTQKNLEHFHKLLLPEAGSSIAHAEEAANKPKKVAKAKGKKR